MTLWAILLPNLLLQPVGDTVWWNTEGGNVTEYRDGDLVTCSLTLSNRDGRFVFVWDRNTPAHIAVSSRLWHNAPGETSNVAVRIGNVWLDHGSGSPNIAAVTDQSAFMFMLDQPVEDLLLSANEVAIRTPKAAFQIPLVRSRTASLVAALRKCRALITR